MKPWYSRHVKLAWGIVLACAVIGSAVAVAVSDIVYHQPLHLLTTTAVQLGFSIAGSLFGTAVGFTIILSIRSKK